MRKLKFRKVKFQGHTAIECLAHQIRVLAFDHIWYLCSPSGAGVSMARWPSVGTPVSPDMVHKVGHQTGSLPNLASSILADTHNQLRTQIGHKCPRHGPWDCHLAVLSVNKAQ